MQPRIVRRKCLLVLVWVCGLWGTAVLAETFALNNGQSITGELIQASANELGVQIKLGEGKYERVPWANFTQEDLKRFKQDKKMEAFVEPFIEITPEERIQKTEVHIKQPPRLERPPSKSLLGAMFSSGLGVFLLLLLYAANLYSAYEVAIFRAQPVGLVCGLAAIPLLGLASPIVFVWMRTKLKPSQAAVETPPAAPAEGEVGGAEAVNPMLDTNVQHPTGLKLHTEEAPAKSSLPKTTTYQRGQFTFNRRFFETKFGNFFAVVRRDADKDMVLVIKAMRGEYEGQRITRIAANDLHLLVQRGHASEEVMIPFQEIKEIQLKHKDA
jgi:hypothetical protein